MLGKEKAEKGGVGTKAAGSKKKLKQRFGKVKIIPQLCTPIESKEIGKGERGEGVS